ncbi:unnamed protein product, partial [Mesorhabditis belari]|uniref:Uncharacterized protein n=1 Tax=Mesorhabditis belari TaxID=2138241 RepID=A0AAF3EBH9_9BILA
MQRFSEILFLFLLTLVGLTVSTKEEKLRCYCTKNTESVKCDENNECYTTGFCLMLDHPTHGRHYTCHSRGLDQDCTTRTAKSGLSVDVCGCKDADRCNLNRWPKSDRSERGDGADASAMNGVSTSFPLFTILSSIIVFTIFTS